MRILSRNMGENHSPSIIAEMFGNSMGSGA